LGKPPLLKADWSSDETLLAAIPERHPCLMGYPSQNLLDCDYQPVRLSEAEFTFLEACDENSSRKRKVGEILNDIELDLDAVRSLQQRQLIVLSK
jgi:hypothetical protein